MKKLMFFGMVMAAVLSAAAQADVYIVYDVSDAYNEVPDWTAYLNANFTTQALGTIYSGEYHDGAPAAGAGDLVVFTRGVDPAGYVNNVAEVTAWNNLEAGILHLSYTQLLGTRFGYYSSAARVTGIVAGAETTVLNAADSLFAGVDVTSGFADLIKDDATLWNNIDTADEPTLATAATGTDGSAVGSSIVRFAQGSSWASTVGTDPSGTHGGDRIFYAMPNKDVNEYPGIIGLTADGLTVLKNCLVELSDLVPGVSNPSPGDGDTVDISGSLPLSWTNMDPNDPSDSVYVDVWFGKNPNIASPDYDWTKIVDALVDGENVTDVNVPASDPNTYYWQVDSYIYGDPFTTSYDTNPGDPNKVEGYLWSFDAAIPVDEAPTVVMVTAAQMTWSDEPVSLEATVTNDDLSATSIVWDANSLAGVTFDPNEYVATPTVKITNDTGSMVTVTMTISVSDGGNPIPVQASVEIDVYPDACAMAIEVEGKIVGSDMDGDCDTDVDDLRMLAAIWLDPKVLPGSIDVPNGDFETLYAADTNDVVTMPIPSWTNGVGADMGLNSTNVYSDGGALADMLGWVEVNPVTGGPVVATQWTPRSGINHIIINGDGWNQPGGLVVSAASLGTADGSALELSMWAQATEGELATYVELDLLANGVALSPTSSVDPAITLLSWAKFSRTYDAATMSAVFGQELTIRFGCTPGGVDTGAQTAFDDISLDLVDGGGMGYINLEEFAKMARVWLVDYASTGPADR